MIRTVTIIVFVWLFAVPGFVLADDGGIRSVSGQSYSPGAAAIIFATNSLNDGDDCSDLWTIKLDGSTLTRVTLTPGIDEDQPAYSPNAARIGFVRVAPSDSLVPSPDRISVYVMNANGTDLQRINRTGKPGFSFAWLSDSQRLVLETALSAGSDLLVRGLSGSDGVVVAASSGNEQDPHCFADDSWVVYSVQSQCSICSEQGRSCSQIWKRNISPRTDPVQLTTGHYEDKRPRISSDGTKIVFMSDRDFVSGYGSSLYVMNADGSGLSRVPIPGDGHDPSWMPDNQILFVLAERDTNAYGSVMNLATISADGSGLSRITQTVMSPVMSPDGGSAPPEGVAITCGTTGAEIRYTTDGSMPTQSSPLYSSPIQLTATSHIRAKAWKSGWLPSLVTDREFDVGP